MRKIWISISCIFLIGIILTFILSYTQQNKKDIVLKLNFDQDVYVAGDFICYNMEVENKGKQSVYYQYDSFSIDITSNQGFHVIANGEGNFHQYELAPKGIIAKNMTGYNQYPYMLAAGIKDFSTYVKVDETAEPEIAQLNINWTTGLTLPVGTYQFHAKFLYYLDQDCLSEPLLAEYTKEIEIHGEGSEALEEEVIIEDRITFYAKTNKTIYKTGERLQTWATYDWFEDGWFPWDCYYYKTPVWIGLIHENGEETDLYSYDIVNILPLYPETYRGAFYLEPRIHYITEPGNYTICYHFGYYMEPGGELNWKTVEFPITVVEQKNKKEFYSPSYPVPAVQQIK